MVPSSNSGFTSSFGKRALLMTMSSRSSFSIWAWRHSHSHSADQPRGDSVMDTIKITEAVDQHRRSFIGAAAMTAAVAQFGMLSAAGAQPNRPTLPDTKPGKNTSFGQLKQIDAGVLNVGYVEAGPAGGPPVILLHGWPYDIYSFVDVAPLLVSVGYRVIVPYLRGYGGARLFFNPTAP